MKKFFTLLTAMLLSSMAFAQADNKFEFVDANGNVVPDGTTITVNTITEDKMIVPLRVRNASGQKNAVSMYETINAKPNGEWQTCAFDNCVILQETGYSAKSIVEGSYFKPIDTEWIPKEEGYATWEATLQIRVFNIVKKKVFNVETETPGDEIIGYGPTVKVKFEYSETSGISTTRTSGQNAVTYYNLNGMRTNAARHGLNIMKRQDGKVMVAQPTRGLYIINGKKVVMK
ncbi:MAG: hypothetical protein J6I52_12030 [Prevotella sp.]|nr:hypothetical protein [Prevotella sp.]